MPRRLRPPEQPITLEVDGHTIAASDGEPLAVALLAAGETLTARSIKYHRPRGPSCLSGACSNCLMRVDGVPNVATCQAKARQGMRVERQNAFPDAKLDVLQAADWVFPKWFNHHEFLAGVPVAEDLLLKIARKLAGLGLLPERPAQPVEPALVEKVAVAIVGAGAAGLAAAQHLDAAGAPFVLFERDGAAGGRLLTAPEDGLPPIYACPAPKLRLGARVVGVYADAGPTFLVAIQAQRAHVIFFDQLLLTNGGHPPFVTFENNELPGIYAGRAVSALLRRHRVLAGDVVACVGDAAEARALGKLLAGAGAKVVAVGATPLKAHGFAHVEALTVSEQGREVKVACDAVAVCGAPFPAFELGRAAGAKVSWEPNSQLFVLDADTRGRTAAPQVWAAGEVRGAMSAAAAAEQGLVAAQAILDARKETP